MIKHKNEHIITLDYDKSIIILKDLILYFQILFLLSFYFLYNRYFYITEIIKCIFNTFNLQILYKYKSGLNKPNNWK